LTLFYQSFNRGQGLFRSLLGNLGEIYNNTLFLGNLFEFLELEPQVHDPPTPTSAPTSLHQSIRFCQLSFRYPGSERKVFQGFDLTIPAGKVVAIVGANGAGKSTLIKLLCRLYDPESGHIELDGTDIRHLSVKELRRLITVMFQFPVPYFTTAAENIAVGDLTVHPVLTEIEAAARSAGADEFISRLPRQYETILGKWFANGAELSGGEWQRLALARAFFRKAQIMILDEPTSLLDSWSEIDWFGRFRELANGRTAIIITHRFTIAKDADIIYVMDNGQIVESGGHQELLAQGGLYAQSWQAQMQGAAADSLEPIQAEPDRPKLATTTLVAASTFERNWNNGRR
jgi:ATP-binding cassette subfamily B protein